jgi:hypothetical protein
MLRDWHVLSDHAQLTLSRQAMRRAAETIAEQAELLAQEIELGTLDDRGGPEALRLLAAVVRVGGEGEATPVSGRA